MHFILFVYILVYVSAWFYFKKIDLPFFTFSYVYVHFHVPFHLNIYIFSLGDRSLVHT
jgi:hypothetical protein